MGFVADVSEELDYMRSLLKKWELHVDGIGSLLYHKLVSATAGFIAGWNSVQPKSNAQ